MPVPVLMYHEVESADLPAKRYSITTAQFESQLDAIRASGRRTVLLEQALGGKARSGSVAITFDDSHDVHFLNSFERLRARDQVATFFVVTSHIDAGPGLLTRAQLREMHAAGMAIESHTHTHPFLDQLPAERILAELRDSKRFLEDCLQTRVRYVSCPGGRLDARVFAAAAEAGFEAVCTSVPGALGARLPRRPVASVPRLIVTGATEAAEFTRMLECDRAYLAVRSAGAHVKGAAKRLLGSNTYYAVWRRFARPDA